MFGNKDCKYALKGLSDISLQEKDNQTIPECVEVAMQDTQNSKRGRSDTVNSIFFSFFTMNVYLYTNCLFSIFLTRIQNHSKDANSTDLDLASMNLIGVRSKFFIQIWSLMSILKDR